QLAIFTSWDRKAKNPQIPNNKLGKAASRSMVLVMGRRRRGGAYSLMNRAIPIPSGAPTDKAIKAMMPVFSMSPRTPNFLPSTPQTDFVRKNQTPLDLNAGRALSKRKKRV